MENISNNEEKQKIENSLKGVFKELERCIQCGKCVGICPAAETSGFNSRRIIHKAKMGEVEEVLNSNVIWQCVFCSACYAVCPNEINFANVAMLLKVISFYYGFGWELDKSAIPNVEQYLQSGMAFPYNETPEITEILKKNSGSSGLIEDIRQRLGLAPRRVVSLNALKEIRHLAHMSGFVKKLEIMKSYDLQDIDEQQKFQWLRELKDVLSLIEKIPGGK